MASFISICSIYSAASALFQSRLDSEAVHHGRQCLGHFRLFRKLRSLLASLLEFLGSFYSSVLYYLHWSKIVETNMYCIFKGESCVLIKRCCSTCSNLRYYWFYQNYKTETVSGSQFFITVLLFLFYCYIMSKILFISLSGRQPSRSKSLSTNQNTVWSEMERICTSHHFRPHLCMVYCRQCYANDFMRYATSQLRRRLHIACC